MIERRYSSRGRKKVVDSEIQSSALIDKRLE
jgi:hypothetical protein